MSTKETEERKAHPLDHQRTKKVLKVPLLWLNL
ncbi:rCG38444 [Rattus norvegicus]|uniref:RCG38444 n=1 Tax=Rattus norvegicus TaxID=10116 RepID=A6KLZ2_RAT|nr:rCG38444 [Rattus norvegicus]